MRSHESRKVEVVDGGTKRKVIKDKTNKVEKKYNESGVTTEGGLNVTNRVK